MEKIGRIGYISGADRIKCQGINEFWRKEEPKMMTRVGSGSVKGRILFPGMVLTLEEFQLLIR